MRAGILLMVVAVALSPASPALAQVFARVDADGAVHLSDRAQAGYARLAPAGLETDPAHAALVRETSRRHRVDPRLVEALIRVESGFDAQAVSPKGAVGLMQLMPATALRYRVTDRFDPAQNVEGGVRYLRDLLALFGGDLQLALAAYNAGEEAVLRHGGRVPPYAESQTYVRRVTALYSRMLEEKKRLPPGAGAAAAAHAD